MMSKFDATTARQNGSDFNMEHRLNSLTCYWMDLFTRSLLRNLAETVGSCQRFIPVNERSKDSLDLVCKSKVDLYTTGREKGTFYL